MESCGWKKNWCYQELITSTKKERCFRNWAGYYFLFNVYKEKLWLSDQEHVLKQQTEFILMKPSTEIWIHWTFICLISQQLVSNTALAKVKLSSSVQLSQASLETSQNMLNIKSFHNISTVSYEMSGAMLYISSSLKIICKIAQNNEPLLNHSELLPTALYPKTIAFVPADWRFIPYDAFPTQTHPKRVIKASHASMHAEKTQKSIDQPSVGICAVSIQGCVRRLMHKHVKTSVQFLCHSFLYHPLVPSIKYVDTKTSL